MTFETYLPTPVVEPEPKRRKLNKQYVPTTVTRSGTEIRSDGTITPLNSSFGVDKDVDMDIENDKTETDEQGCSCGFLHGPGDQQAHDIKAVGLSSNMMRGPD